MKTNGGQAFANDTYSGMSLRDYFAAKAMQGIISHNWNEITINEAIAVDAYKIADLMLKAREEL